MNRLREKYNAEVAPKLQEELSIKNRMALPRLKQITIGVGLGEAKDHPPVLESVAKYLAALAGQKPATTYAKKSISTFKLSKGQPIGMMVTLRGDKMYSFLDKLVSIVLPKVRDFRGVNEGSFDTHGNLNLGFKEQVIFPEVDYRTVDKTRGLGVTIVTTAKNREQGKKLLEHLGMPFKKEGK